MSAPVLIVRLPIEGYPHLTIVAETFEAELALRRWLEFGYAARDVAAALANLDGWLEEQGWREAA